MSTKQPNWKLVAQLGDVNPLDHGGLFVYEDATGVYPPEMAKLDPPEDSMADSPQAKWTEYRAILEPCTFIGGILSDNKFHAAHPAWFADSIGSIANSMDIPVSELIDSITNGNTPYRAAAWQAIGDYHGWENLDQYPLSFTREEIESRYPRETWRV